jgi:hypothetical protein
MFETTRDLSKNRNLRFVRAPRSGVLRLSTGCKLRCMCATECSRDWTSHMGGIAAIDITEALVSSAVVAAIVGGMSSFLTQRYRL